MYYADSYICVNIYIHTMNYKYILTYVRCLDICLE